MADQPKKKSKTLKMFACPSQCSLRKVIISLLLRVFTSKGQKTKRQPSGKN